MTFPAGSGEKNKESRSQNRQCQNFVDPFLIESCPAGKIGYINRQREDQRQSERQPCPPEGFFFLLQDESKFMVVRPIGTSAEGWSIGEEFWRRI